MLTGVNIVKAPVASGNDAPTVLSTQHAGATEAHITMTPQLMILPLPLDPAAVQLPGIYEPTHPLTRWMLTRGTPIGLAPVQMIQVAQQALAAIPPESAQ
jgi:hypothetical protein